jgi:hypothetical protein
MIDLCWRAYLVCAIVLWVVLLTIVWLVDQRWWYVALNLLFLMTAVFYLFFFALMWKDGTLFRLYTAECK